MYKIIGADGREYGPATAEQIRQWTGEGRVNARTLTLVPGASEWRPLGAIPEFAGWFAPLRPPVIGPSPMRKTNAFAVAGLVSGILSLTCCCCGCVFSVLGILFSIIGLSQINRHPELYEGRWLAIAGLSLSVVSLVGGLALTLFRLMLHPAHVLWRFGTF